MSNYKIRQFSKDFTNRFPERGELGRVFLYNAVIEVDVDGTAFLVLGSGIRRQLTDEEAEALSEELP